MQTRVFQNLMFALLLATVCRMESLAQPATGKYAESADETFQRAIDQRAFSPYGTVRESYLEAISKFDPKVATRLETYISETTDKAKKAHAVGFLGHTGNESDIELIMTVLREYKGNLAINDQYVVFDSIKAISYMSYRGIGRATAEMDRMIDPDYWKGFDFVIDSAGVRESYYDSNTQMAIFALLDKSRTMDPAFPEKAQAVLEKLVDPVQRRRYQDRLASAMRTHSDQMLAKGAVDRVTRARYGARWGAPPQKAAPTPAKPVSMGALLNLYRPENRVDLSVAPAAAGRIVNQAAAEYARISTHLAGAKDDDNRTSWLMHLADNGIPLPLKDRPEALAKAMMQPRFKDDLDGKTLPMAARLRDRKPDLARARVSLFRLQPSPDPLPASAATDPESVADVIVVAIPFQSPAEARAAVQGKLNRAGANELIPTMDPDGAPVILMIWHAGEWYWNPFGW